MISRRTGTNLQNFKILEYYQVTGPSGLNFYELPEMRKTKELWKNLFAFAENNYSMLNYQPL